MIESENIIWSWTSGYWLIHLRCVDTSVSHHHRHHILANSALPSSVGLHSFNSPPNGADLCVRRDCFGGCETITKEASTILLMGLTFARLCNPKKQKKKKKKE